MADQNNNQNLSVKRYAARIAMEGEAEKVRREAEEKAARDKEIAAELIKQKELDKAAAAERVIKDKLEEEAREKRAADEASSKIKTEVEKIKTVGAQIGTLRTLKRDMDELIRNQSISLARIAMEEDARRRAGGATGQQTRNWLTLLASLILIASGLGIGGYIYLNYKPSEENIPSTETAEKTIFPITIETKKELSLSGLPSEKAISEIKNAVSGSDVAAGNLQRIKLTKKSDTGDAADITSQEFFTIIGSSAPGDLTRSLNKEMLLGVLNTLIGAKSGVLIFNVESYQNAFAGMLNWEQGSMVKDIYETVTSNSADDFLITKKFE
ncbi:MAG TPA: hypothetical protein P5056_04045, partial [Candidatus Paceibacterota bacterium]|nr:hypothetical protein [Candidatus Paceibacterota bacterium]